LKHGIKPVPDGKIRKKRRVIRVDKLNLTHPQQEAIKLLVQAQRNKYKKLLHETHERMHVIADHQYGLEFWLGLTGLYEYISPSCERITGFTKADFVDQHITLDALIHPEYLERFNADRQLSLEGIGNVDVEYRWIHKDGSTHWALATWSPVYTRRARHIGTLLSIRDITSEKLHARESRAAHESCLRLASRSGFLCICSPDGVIVSLPPDAAKFADMLPPPATGKLIAELFSGSNRNSLHASFDKIKAGEVSADFAASLATKSGTKPVDVHIFAFHTPGPVEEVFVTISVSPGA
jgi:PAS domain S-box-containing protein